MRQMLEGCEIELSRASGVLEIVQRSSRMMNDGVHSGGRAFFRASNI